MGMRTRRGLGAGVAIATLLSAMGTGAALAAPEAGTARPELASRQHDRPGPLAQRQRELRQEAVGRIRRGEAAASSRGTVKVAEDKWVQTEVAGTGLIFTTLAEFGDGTSGRLGDMPGPVHNAIPAPDRTVDNTTIWRSDFGQRYYEDVLFGRRNSMADFYRAQSGGAYTVDGYVSDWVQVGGNGSSYGDNAVEDAGGTWQFVDDSVDAWAAAYGDGACDLLADFDVWDRYDWDEDGDFDEPDGYLDHYQAIHAGMGEETGGGVLGADAIWSHRWYVGTGFGETGPKVTSDDGTTVLLDWGGAKIGDCDIWVGDYTTEPENGGLGVFAHEYAHDLGLPDLYDTNGGENSTAFWTLMSSGSYMNDGSTDIGSRPNFMGPWEKMQLGWLGYTVVDDASDSGEYQLRPASATSGRGTQALVVDVTDEDRKVPYTSPVEGEYAWWTGSADDLDVKLRWPEAIDTSGMRRPSVTAKVWYDIEAGYDYLYTEVSTDGGADWTPVGALDGSSNGRWSSLSWAVPSVPDLRVRFRYVTDGGVHYVGAFLDEVQIGERRSTTTLVEGAWTADGAEGAPRWTLSSGTIDETGDRYYLMENRQYTGYDDTLETGPYNWSEPYTRYDWAERFPFQDGLLVWVSNETYDDNNTSQHPGNGIALPLDAHHTALRWKDGTLMRNRTQPFDATFGGETTDEVTLHRQLIQRNRVVDDEMAIGGKAAVEVFHDSSPTVHYDAANPRGSSRTAGSQVEVEVLDQAGLMTVGVTYP